MSTKDQYIRLITFLFFLSGAGALIYQVVWQRVLTQAIGVDHIAIVFIVTIFMMGLGIGSFAGGLVTTLPNRTVMIAYAALEFAVGVFGIFSNDALRWLNDWNARGGTTGITRDFAVNCIFLVGPIILMGMTTPMLIHLLRDRTANFGTTIGRYYGANIVGAAFGALCSLFLIELFGLFDTTLFAVAINFLIGGVFLTLALKPDSVLAADTPGLTDALTPETTEASNDPSEPSRSVAWTYLASFLFGAANLAIQIVVFRLFINYLSPISYIFPIGIASYLFLMALGQSFGGRWVDSVQPSEYPRLLLCILAGTAAMFIVVLNIPYSFLDNLSSPFGKWHYGFMLLTAFPLALVFMSPTFFASAFLPVMAKAVLPDIKSAGRSFGMVLAASTMGNIFGAFFVGVFLFEWIGAIASVFVLIAAIAAGVLLVSLGHSEAGVNFRLPVAGGWRETLRAIGSALAIWKPGASFGGRNAIAPALAVVAGSMLLIPGNYFGQAFSKSRDFTKTFGTVKPIDILEGRSSVTSIYWNKVLPYRFEVRPANSGAAAALAHEAAVFYKYYALGNVFAIDPLFRPKKILQVGMGSGEFPFVIKEVQTVEHVDMVELVPEVVEAYKKYSHPLIGQTVGHPKVSFHITDGRRFLQQAIAKGDKYDLIEIGITQLGSSGVSNMYSLDLMRRVKGLLNPNGYLAMEAYVSLARLGLEAFEDGYVLEGSSWIFFHDHKVPEYKNGQDVKVEEFVLRLLNAKRFEDLSTPLEGKKCVPSTVKYSRLVRSTFIPRYDWMLGTDDSLPFEYNYLRRHRKDYTPVIQLVPTVPGALTPEITFTAASDCSK